MVQVSSWANPLRYDGLRLELGMWLLLLEHSFSYQASLDFAGGGLGPEVK
jgi:hypothetical protein